MPGSLVTGRKLKKLAKANGKVGRISAKYMLRLIREKYGKVQDNARYYYRGAGKVAKYSAQRDLKRKGYKSRNLTVQHLSKFMYYHMYNLKKKKMRGKGGTYIYFK